ncbi:RdgB/HAM1 family non-canonical purine NTP pyrophosphatase [Paracoccus sp. P2]|uniref:dITP/XTP pyrophosphatase n=1 Tax=Paracoccus pantotrophus TaxID=82367 RepID=A0AAE6TUY9_PARPN|nr:RdgB/HAM1 family non-canonical purine NTP pyrophosphatase [Paracoccus pantotrophus]MDF3854414.1 RdgB/HAM1 family non-canonical purine NTP pyrophosphatase [Paracoccus pantotrophus]QFG38536.1 RdgB/HAM1 family non-canonical purine NTP pyrophosphatase [Paracoccus pantotrophus]RDE02002.1 RdgB/HAM1 family non-canonical purine NTP pyrophosphatase [Paracoccus pantotrophus]RKS50932.1 dITPase [Paracoccus pantotrophus]RNI19297.1 RdgB/HAM1 family non-canonical purine NTP pyrophosphatase [Paracoccus pan
MRKLTEKKLLVATHNRGKLDEIRAMMAPHGIEVTSAGEMGLPEPAETESSFIGNARIKARAAMQATGLPVLADDSGITVDGLDGAPGVYTADWAETPQGRDFMQAMTRTWRELDERGVAEPRSAQFRATLILLWPDGHEEIFEGVAPGRLVWPPRGQQGHGYDPIFVPDGHDLTYAEMPPEQKNAISHRARAFRKLEALFA